ncbi:hypothetical protein T484DRAFT_1859465 [Baffinella frigidus]|nr:hypothetical protein T484DRAFT_1859465 [Cryptophyta sp. CCMP2293]
MDVDAFWQHMVAALARANEASPLNATNKDASPITASNKDAPPLKAANKDGGGGSGARNVRQKRSGRGG